MFRRLKSAIDNFYLRIMPAFWLRLSPSFQWAGGIAILAVFWIATGAFSSHKVIDDGAQAKAVGLPRVSVALLTASNRDATISVQGRTQALHSVDVRTEVDGVVQALHFEKGDHVKKGDVLCELKENDRVAKVDQTRAMVAQTSKQHEVDLKLAEDGFRSKVQVAQSEAALEAAMASQRTMEIQLSDTKMRAPFDGFVDDRYVNVGDYMRAGDKCALVIAPEPFLAVGMVTEQEVGQVHIGDPATAILVTGETVTGKVRFVADKADEATRAFRVEVELPNSDAKLRDGVSADIRIPVRELQAQKISPGILVLDDNGVIGVRVVQDGVVHFVAVKIVSDGPDGMWISGLPDHATVITVGQEFVNDGERVTPVPYKGGTAS
jgi:membrane fusion protein, multidrug efflux system